MGYPTNVPLVRLSFSDGFKYYGDDTVLTVSATVNLSVPEAVHRATGETLVDGQLIPAQDVAAFDVPRVDRNGWATPDGSTLNGWSYDVSLAITAAGEPPLLWVATVTPRKGGETITPGLGTFGGLAPVTENAPGEYTIGA